jgi:HAD superfamily hydrolase (TIGR01509 family)
MKAVIFDFDGLIVDTETPAFEAWSDIYRENGAELLKEDWVQVVGTTYSNFHPVDHLNKLTGKNFDRKKLSEEKDRRKAAICDSMPILPGVKALITQAQGLGIKIGLASTSESAWVEHHLTRVGLMKHFPVRITRENVENVKPHPEPYLKVMALLQVKPEQAMIFEDSLNGVKAAKAAGATCIAVPNSVTNVLDFAEADSRVGSLADIDLQSWL